MKKRLFFMGVAGMLAVSIPGCRQDVDQSPPPPETALDAAVVRAQRFLESKVGVPALPNTYYKAGVNPSQTRAGETAPMLGDAIVPDWPEAKTWEYEGDIVTEVPATLTRPVTYTTLVEERGDTVSLTSQAPHTRIRAIERPDTEEMFTFVITLLPDESYVGDLSRLGSNPVGSDYSGIAVYSGPDGTPILGYRYVEGEITGSMLFDGGENQAGPGVRIAMGIDGGPATRAAPQSRLIEIIVGDCYIYFFYSDGRIECVISSIVVNANKDDEEGGGSGGGGGILPPPRQPLPIPGGNGNPDPEDTQEVKYTVSVSAGPAAGGTVSGGGIYPANSSATISAIANPGYVFVNWTGSATSTSSRYTVKVTNSMSFVANFKSDSVAPKAKKLFDSDELTDEEWMKIEEMIEEIMADCIGGALYNGLDAAMGSGTLQIKFLNSSMAEGTFSLSGTISITNYEDSSTLFHEMFHAYQAYQESEASFDVASANREVEAYIAEHRYLQHINNNSFDPSPPWSKENSFGPQIAYLSDRYLSNNGGINDPSLSNLVNDIFKNTAQRIKQVYEQNYGNPTPFDNTRSINQNFKNLQYLSKNC